ncbi:antibiotic biosynthesis monooxygenase [Mangrovimicrobium sediminis]|uniref:Antibiotic biosynthesis monooxygenase n=1 Tax=Mangrovimicrobium sediminis TaxID=2562682 RepID=A0A4Z0M6E5_9GAMM|nr:antibiotic biosynthesis monooxygenase [Haliea sp. SAOS-164]TGD75079.1 antibiotic biosynthesis monooxygenase [Haliea sp. SAOS-164]
MYIAMNRFRIAPGREQDFIDIWKNRETFLEEVPGFREFHLLQGPSSEECTLFASHSTWDSAEAFSEWTRSEAFRKAHAGAGSSRDIYLGPPQFEGFEAVA